MFYSADLVSKFSHNFSTSRNSFLSYDLGNSTFVYPESKNRVFERSQLFDTIDPDRRPVLLLNQNSSEFIVNLLACWISNRPVVPLCLPSKKRVDFIDTIVEQTGSLIYTIDNNHSQVFNLRSRSSSLLSNLAEVTSDTSNISASVLSSYSIPPKPLFPKSTAVIQYSSGSTGSPKGVLITASNISASLELMSDAWNITSSSSFYSWLPLYHDLGFVFGILLPLMYGCRSYIISSADFAKKPSVWLSNLSSLEITHTAGSTSGYAMATRQTYYESLSLKACEFCMIAAEHISSTVVSNFLDIAIPFGLSSKALSAAYGLAESTLAVTADRISDSLLTLAFDQSGLNSGFAHPSSNGRLLVSCGYPLPDTRISIEDQDKVLPPGRIGEVVVEGPTVMHGYLGDSNHSQLLKLYTGDLGFFYNGHLFITGRKKELIIINGKNIYPEDIESAVKSNFKLFANSTSVCFCVDNDDGMDTIVFIAELDRHVSISSPLSLFDQINKLIIDLSGRSCHDILFVQKAQIPKTTSGKLQRLKARDLYLKHQIKVLYSFYDIQTKTHSLPCEAFTAEKLIRWLKDYENENGDPVLRSVRGQFFITLDSVGSSELKNFIKSSTGIMLDDTFIWEYDTVEKLVDFLQLEGI
ncbi:AMP-binding enzyme family protein [Synechococcus sp. MEDNS5]|nr:AMP-binding enzyme family protein [Synechococcus sp. MEDNS5]